MKNTRNVPMKDKIKAIIKILKRKYDISKFKRKNPFEALIKTVLSQRTKDSTTYNINKRLFSKLKNINAFSKASEKEIKSLIKGVGFYNVKAKRIKEIVRILKEKYNGKVPKELNELIKLPGVGMKTASCVLLYGYGIPYIPVDVHVFVISRRLGLTNEKTPNKVQKDLEKKILKELQPLVNSLFVEFGKNICLTRNPKCKICPISKYCDYYKKIKK